MYVEHKNVFRTVASCIADALSNKLVTENILTGKETTTYFKNGKIHRSGDRPAIISRHPDTGMVTLERFYKNGKHHRDGEKPAFIYYDPKTGAVKGEKYYKDGQLYRTGGKPTEILYDEKTGVIKSQGFVGSIEYDQNRTPLPSSGSAYPTAGLGSG